MSHQRSPQALAVGEVTNPHRHVRIEKITLNIGCGTAVKVENATKIIGLIAAMKPVVTVSKRRSTFGVTKGTPIGCKVTIRKDTTTVFKRLIAAKEFMLKEHNFDNTGNLSFGVNEYIDIPGVGYEPSIGMLGMDVCVTLCRPGYRVKRKRLSKPIGARHVIAKQDAIAFVQSLGVKVEA